VTRPHVLGGRRIDITTRPDVARLIPATEVARVVAAAMDAAGAPARAGLSVILTDDDELADLNVAHLGHAGPTDVLSFPLLPPEAFPSHPGKGEATRPAATTFTLPPRARVHLGDIAISVDRAIAQASEGRGGQTGDRRWAPADELRLLLTHGTLHVCGWDHAEPAEERAMRALERRLLGDVPA
jgi:probable rRNA maturation factor